MPNLKLFHCDGESLDGRYAYLWMETSVDLLEQPMHTSISNLPVCEVDMEDVKTLPAPAWVANKIMKKRNDKWPVEQFHRIVRKWPYSAAALADLKARSD